MATAYLDTNRITDWQSFHTLCKEVMGFPDFYGMNMNAWIDCLSDLGDDYGLSRYNNLPLGEMLYIELSNTKDLMERLPEVFAALVDCAAFVNFRYMDGGKQPRLAIVPLEQAHMGRSYGTPRNVR